MRHYGKVAYNPLPWIWERGDFHLDERSVREAVAGTAAAGFSAIPADIPESMSAEEYLDLLGAVGLQPAPGYIAVHLDVTGLELADQIGWALIQARKQQALGLREVLIASHLCAERVARPATGEAYDADRLQQVVSSLRLVATAISELGLRPCLHPHIGTWIETEQELRVSLDSIDPEVLGFGPDTGHLTWAGMQAPAVIADYATRVGVLHVKDVRRDAVSQALRRGADFDTSMFDTRIWAEPGRGDLDLAACLAALPSDYGGWIVIEVDVPYGLTKEESAAWCYAWAAKVLAPMT